MKKVFKILITLLTIALLFAGCATNTSTKTTSQNKFNKNELTIVTSFYPMYIHAINVTRDIPNVRVINMTKPQTGCLHDYTLTTDDMKTIEAAQVFVINGIGMEQFIDKVISQLPNLKVIEASKGIEIIKENSDSEGNPHVWVSITNAIKQVKNIGEQLISIDPKNATLYQNNVDAYVKKLEAEKTKMHLEMDTITNRNIITFHEAFPYFAKEFNLNIVAVVEREPGTEPNAKEIEDTINIIKASNVKALFAEPQYPVKTAQIISNETGAKLYTLDPGVTGDANGDYDAYIKIMENNLKVLIEALK